MYINLSILCEQIKIWERQLTLVMNNDIINAVSSVSHILGHDAVIGVGTQRLPGVELLPALVAAVAPVRGEVAALKVVLPGVLIPHKLVADLTDVAAPPHVAAEVLVRQLLEGRAHRLYRRSAAVSSCNKPLVITLRIFI